MNVPGIINVIERVVLVLIIVLTLIAVGLEVREIVRRGTVVIADILLLFLYTEVISMAGAFYESRRIPVIYPLLIAITALSRLIVLQSKEMAPETILYEAAAVFVLAGAVIGLSWSEHRIAEQRLPQPRAPDDGEDGKQDAKGGG
jgi:protein PsiE